MWFPVFPFGGAGATFITEVLAMRSGEMYETVLLFDMQYAPEIFCPCMSVHV